MKKNYKGILVIIALVTVVLIALAIADETDEDMDMLLSGSISVQVSGSTYDADPVSADEIDETMPDEVSEEAFTVCDVDAEEAAADEITVNTVPDAISAEAAVEAVTAEAPSEEPAAEPAEVLVSEPAEATVEAVTVEEPSEEPAAEPAEVLVSEPAEATVEAVTAEASSEEPAAESAEVLVSEPAEATVEAVTVEESSEEPAEVLASKPAEATVEALNGKAEAPAAGETNKRPFDFLLDEDGKLVLDEKGMPVPLAEEGYAIIATYKMDEDGNLVLDEEGYPIVLDYEVRYIDLDVHIVLINLEEDGILTYGAHVCLQAVVDNAPEGVELHYEWYNSADWDHPLPVSGDSYSFVVNHDNAMYSWRVDVWF